MKKLKVFFMLLPLLAFMGCSADGPEVVAEDFIKAVYTADFDGAKKLCTEESRQAVDFVAAFASEKVDEMKKAKVTIEQESVEIAEDGNSAVVKLIVHGSIDMQDNEVVDSKTEKIDLVKVDKKWLVNYKLK
jgi:hypothetical protein